MAKKPITATITPPVQGLQVASSESEKVLALMPDLTSRVDDLTIQTDEDYELADAVLGQINDLRKGWGKIWTVIQEKTIKPIRQGLEGLYEIDRRVEKPAEALAKRLRDKMTAYQREKLAIQQRQEQQEREERERLEREAERKRQQAEQAKTPQLRGRLESQATQLEEKATAVQSSGFYQTMPTGTRSAPRRGKKVEYTLDDLLVGIIEGDIPPSMITVNVADIMAQWKLDPEKVEKWPGVKIVDDVNVVGR